VVARRTNIHKGVDPLHKVCKSINCSHALAKYDQLALALSVFLIPTTEWSPSKNVVTLAASQSPKAALNPDE